MNEQNDNDKERKYHYELNWMEQMKRSLMTDDD